MLPQTEAVDYFLISYSSIHPDQVCVPLSDAVFFFFLQSNLNEPKRYLISAGTEFVYVLQRFLGIQLFIRRISGTSNLDAVTDSLTKPLTCQH